MLSRRWAVFAILFAARTTIAYQFQSVGSIGPVLVDETPLDFATLGLLIGCYMLPGVALAFPGGLLDQRFGARRIVIFGLVLMVAGGIAMAMGSVPLMFGGRLVSGAGAAILNVVLARMVADWFAEGELVAVMGAFVASWPLGIALALVTLPAVTVAFGWSAAMAVATLPSLACLAVFVVAHAASEARVRALAPSLRVDLSGREVLLAAVAGLVWGLYNVAYVVFVSALPEFFGARGHTLTEAAAVASILGWVLLLSLPTGGYLGQRVGHANAAMIACFIVIGGSAASLALTDATAVSLAVLAVAFGLPAGLIMALPSKVLAPDKRPVGMGVFFTVFYIALATLPGWRGSCVSRADRWIRPSCSAPPSSARPRSSWPGSPGSGEGRRGSRSARPEPDRGAGAHRLAGAGSRGQPNATRQIPRAAMLRPGTLHVRRQPDMAFARHPPRVGPMKITAIHSQIVSLPFDMGGPPASFAGKPWTHLDILLVGVETDEGLIGWGEAFGHAGIHATRAALDTIVAPLVLGRPSGDIVEITRSVLHGVHLLGRNGPFVYAFSGIEIALWDLAGKRARQPLARLLGGGARTEMDAYASLLAYGDPALVRRNTEAACARGFRHIKLHEVTRETVAAGAEAAKAAGAGLMVDVNCLWSVPAALEMAEAFAPHGLVWLEEPVWPPEDAQGLARVRRRGIPIAAGENTAGLHGFKALVEAGAIDFAQPSVTKVGGIGEMLRVIAFCGAHGVTVAPHSPYFGPGFIATLHIVSALIERPLVEILWLDMEANPFDPWVRAENGRVRLPPGPGLGCDPDPAILERYRVGDIVRTGRGRS